MLNNNLPGELETASATCTRSAPRVLMLSPQFRPIVGGYERAAERLSQALAKRGCDVCVITDRRQSGWPRRETIDGFVVRRLSCIYRPGWHLATSILAHAAWLLMHGRRFDIWHVHQYGAHTTLAVLLGGLLRRRVVLKLTSSSHQGIGNTLHHEPLAALQQWAHRRVDACVAVSAQTADEASGFGIERSRINEIPNGVDTELFCPATDAQRDALRDRLELDRGVNLAVCVGRLAEEKNPLGVVEAWWKAGPGFRRPWLLALVGDGPLRQAVAERIRELGIAHSVRIVGNSDRVQDWLRAADLFVLGSHNEGMANTALEAMACGLSSVVTAVSGMDALMARTGAGLVVPPGDVTALAQAVGILHDDDRRRRAMGAKAREVAFRDYSIAEVASRHLALYGHLLGNSRHV